MGVPKLKTKISATEYLKDELVRQTRHEFVSGEVYAMAGANDRHHRIAANLFTKLDAHLIGSNCDAFITEIKVKVNEELFYYPDVFVACDKNPASAYYREHPVLVIEVASPSTRQTDRREKLRAYQQMADVLEYVLVEQDKLHIELHRRQPDRQAIRPILILKAEVFRIRTNKALKMNRKKISHEKAASFTN